MGKKSSLILFGFFVSLLFTVSVPLSGESCICNSPTSIAMLDNFCKSYCKEDFGEGVCAGWELYEGNCVSEGCLRNRMACFL